MPKYWKRVVLHVFEGFIRVGGTSKKIHLKPVEKHCFNRNVDIFELEQPNETFVTVGIFCNKLVWKEPQTVDKRSCTFSVRYFEQLEQGTFCKDRKQKP